MLPVSEEITSPESAATIDTLLQADPPASAKTTSTPLSSRVSRNPWLHARSAHTSNNPRGATTRSKPRSWALSASWYLTSPVIRTSALPGISSNSPIPLPGTTATELMLRSGSPVHDGGRVQQLPHRRGHSFKCSRGTQCAYPTQTPTATHVLQRIDVKRGLFVGVRLYESVDYRGHAGRWHQCLPSYLFRLLQPPPRSDVWVGALAGHEGSPPLGIEGTMAVVSERTGSSFIRSSNHGFICR